MNQKIIIGIVFLVLIALAIFYVKGATVRTAYVSGTKVRIADHEYSVDVADTMMTQAQGLSGREGLAKNSGMLFIFDPPRSEMFWMHGMKFAIDIIWIKTNTLANGVRESSVVGFEEDAPVPSGGMPATFSSPGEVDLVLEVAAGTVAKDGIKVGDKVEILR